ncbi:hypothetical protein GGQ99_001060 [Aminobacter niigataensis]|uniref:Sulfotransferase family protein n=1 Tax=Aminobacter niigataensis TaxID=83265 RepID=A0ABR6KXS8_9HYPH|nr:sulfotransferase family 2 domain-containing protein [Aminobacter niigataensis]MBB4649338.1 hypothetical protein [Aminobacter niigataensis]
MALINNTHRFVFVHIPKCAGTAATLDLSSLTRACDIELGGTEFGEALLPAYSNRFRVSKHSTAQELAEAIGKDRWRTYFTFAFVRHPFDRAVSTFRFLKRWREWNGSEIMDEFQNVNEFIAHSYWDGPGIDRILEPQTTFTAHGTSHEVDRTFKIEAYDEAMRELFTRVGTVWTGPEEGFRNISPEVASQEATLALNPTSCQKIISRYQCDFLAFNYKTDLALAGTRGG